MIIDRQDGTYIIEHDGMPYHVIEGDPLMDEVLQRIADGEEVQIETEPTETERILSSVEGDLQWFIFALIEKMEARLLQFFEQGFVFNTHQIQGDKTAQQNANAFMVLASTGEAVYPLYWRTRDNSFMPLNNLDEVKAFSKAMLGFVQGEYQKIWTAKDSIRTATTIEDAELIYNNYIGA